MWEISRDRRDRIDLNRVVPKHILTKAYEGTRKKNKHKFRHIAVNTEENSSIQ